MDRRKFLRFSAGGAAGAAIGASLAYMKPFSHSPEKEAGRLEMAQDLAWALLNSPAFLFNR